MLECYSRTWGGDGNGLVGYTGEVEVPGAFWPLLRAFDADQWVAFADTRLGFRMSDPDAYEAQLRDAVRRWSETNGTPESEARELFEDEDRLSDAFVPIETADDAYIRRWLAPAASQFAILEGGYTADRMPPHGLVDMCELTHAPAYTAELDLSALPVSVQLLVLSRTGSLAPSHAAHLERQPGFERRTIAVSPEELDYVLEFAWTGQVDTLSVRALAELRGRFGGEPADAPRLGFADADFAAHFPLAQTLLGCSWHRKFDRTLYLGSPLVVVCGDSAADFTYAYTRRRAVGPTFWLPVDDDAEVNRAVFGALARHLATSRRGSGLEREVLLTSLTMSVEKLETIRAEVLGTVWGRALGNRSSPTLRVCAPADVPTERKWLLADSTHIGVEHYEPFAGDTMVRALDLLKPSEARGVSATAFSWQVDVAAPGHQVPARWALHELLSAGDMLMPGAVRAGVEGLSVNSHGKILQIDGVVPHQALVRTRLRLPGPFEIFSKLADQSGAQLRDSDKGRYTRRMLELWGGLSALAEDLRSDGPVRKILKEWISANGVHGRIQHGRKFLRLGDLVRILDYGKPELARARDEARELLDRFLTASIAFRGVVLRCGLCADTSFYRLEDLDPAYQCPRCRRRSAITHGSWPMGESGPFEPDWYYVLDEVAYLGLRNDIHVPILALAQMAKASTSFLHMPEVIVARDGETDLEVDLWAIVDGRIVIGEAKKGDVLAGTQDEETGRCAALLRLARELSADEFVMASGASRWRERTRRNVESTLGQEMTVTWKAGFR
ncbi:hypothetical protein KDK95_20455 [Actinospica sp. MGRD01-02]|uniref:Uncharacterized protein n=2 Tax=Actinospica acidithermotolerans TaxID=2828514 RepID=A0A941ECC4_9ACTN|nr:hypothetical protein [Actinospica acidithermotolerans]